MPPANARGAAERTAPPRTSDNASRAKSFMGFPHLSNSIRRDDPQRRMPIFFEPKPCGNSFRTPRYCAWTPAAGSLGLWLRPSAPAASPRASLVLMKVNPLRLTRRHRTMSQELNECCGILVRRPRFPPGLYCLHSLCYEESGKKSRDINVTNFRESGPGVLRNFARRSRNGERAFVESSRPFRGPSRAGL